MEVGQKQIALMIAAREKGAAEMPDELKEAMSTLLKLGALDATASDPDGALAPDPDHLGYLWRDVSGKRVFVPFHLAKVSPTSDLLAEVIDIGGMVQLDENNPICISGSTTFLGALNVVADLDFCEYYLLPGGDCAAALNAASAIADMPLVWAKFDDTHLSAPWTCLSGVAERFCEAPARLKLDFMSCGRLGPMPTTSVILPTADGEDGCASESFAYQEAVIGANAPLRALVKPERFGEYLRFLREQARDYVAGSSDQPRYAIKALKRLLALRAALGDRDEVDAIVAKLNRPEIEEVVQRIRLDELLAMRRHLPRDTPSRFADQIAALESAPSLISAGEVEEALALAHTLAVALLEETERDFAEYA